MHRARVELWMESVTGSIYLGDHGVDKHYLNMIQWKTNTLSSQLWYHSLFPTTYESIQLCYSSKVGGITSSHPLSMQLGAELIFLTKFIGIT
jgi:hypothetical protein